MRGPWTENEINYGNITLRNQRKKIENCENYAQWNHPKSVHLFNDSIKPLIILA